MGAAEDDYEQQDLVNQQQQQQQGADQAGFGSVPLQHALPALLGQEADSLMALRGAFFRRGGAEETFSAAAAAGDLAAAAAAGSSASPMMRDLGSGRRQQQQQKRREVPQHNWIRPRPALLQPQQQQPQKDRQQQQQQLVLFGGRDEELSQQQQQQALTAGAVITAPITPRALQKQRQQPDSATAAAAADLLAPATAVANSGAVIDASLMLARSFRVSWGPNGVLAIPQNPGMTGSSSSSGSRTLAGPSVGYSMIDGDGDRDSKRQRTVCTAEDLGVPCIELRQLNSIAAVVGSSSSSSDLAAVLRSSDHDSAAADVMQQRLINSLELHLQYSSRGSSSNSDLAAAAAAAGDADIMDHEQQGSAAAAAGGCSDQWRLHVDRHQIADFVQQQITCIESAGSSSSSSSSVLESAGCNQHIKDLWNLLKVRLLRQSSSVSVENAFAVPLIPMNSQTLWCYV